ncbi:MAG: hypothetical protein HZB38_07630 [Planctomycetes bacterium]|nr:hypothetical protein [Planctomycetota bacterium]
MEKTTLILGLRLPAHKKNLEKPDRSPGAPNSAASATHPSGNGKTTKHSVFPHLAASVNIYSFGRLGAAERRPGGSGERENQRCVAAAYLLV